MPAKLKNNSAKAKAARAAERADTAGAGKVGAPKGVGHKRKPVRTYNSYLFKVLKQVHPDCGISHGAMGVMNSFVNDCFQKIAGEATKLSMYSKKGTINAREIQTAVQLCLPGELAKHGVSEGTKAVGKFTANKS